MANPQTEYGHLQIANDLWEAIARQNLSGQEFRVLIAVLRKTYGFKKKEEWLTNRCLAMATGLHKKSVSRAVTRLVERRILRVNQNVDRYKRIVGINKDYDEWLGSTDLHPINQNEDGGSTDLGTGGQPKCGTHLIKETSIKETLTKERAIEYFGEKLGYEVASRMEPIIYDFKNARKTKTLAPSILVKLADYWAKFGPNMLLEAKKVWQEKRYAQDGFDEKYFNGILRELSKQAQRRRGR